VTNVFDFSVLASMSSLRTVSVELPTNVTLDKIAKLFQLTSLDALGGFKLPSLKPLAALVNLRRLKLWSGSLNSTHGLLGFGELEVLNLGHSKLRDTLDLGSLTGLKKLELVGNKAISSLSFLEEGDLEFLGMYEIPTLDSFGPVLRLPNLKEIRSDAKITDGDLLPLLSHPSLEKVTLPGRYKAQLKKLRIDSKCVFKVGRETLKVTKNGPIVLETAGEAKERVQKS
jgi:Leucine-rich repeat (LRR) protein